MTSVISATLMKEFTSTKLNIADTFISECKAILTLKLTAMEPTGRETVVLLPLKDQQPRRFLMSHFVDRILQSEVIGILRMM
jgi:hypothetical protein